MSKACEGCLWDCHEYHRSLVVEPQLGLLLVCLGTASLESGSRSWLGFYLQPIPRGLNIPVVVNGQVTISPGDGLTEWHQRNKQKAVRVQVGLSAFSRHAGWISQSAASE